MIKNILIDVDGVLNQFVKALMNVCGDVTYTDKDYPIACGYNVVDATNYRTKHGLAYDEFWNNLGRDFWAKVPKSRECDLIIGHANALVGPNRMCIATAPTWDPLSAAGKIDWIRSHLPRFLHVDGYLIGKPKQFMANSESLLIDDSDENCEIFREWGGHTLLVPRPWNTAHKLDTMDTINEFFIRERQQLALVA